MQEALARLKGASLGSAEDIRRRYAEKPIKLLQFIDPTTLFPKKIRYIFALIWLQQDEKGKPAPASSSKARAVVVSQRSLAHSASCSGFCAATRS